MDWLTLLVDQAYAAALDPDLWRAFTERLSIELGSIGGNFIVLDADQLAPRAIQMVRRLGELQGEYAGEWWQYDPQVPLACSVKTSTIYTNHDYRDAPRDEIRAYRQA